MRQFVHNLRFNRLTVAIFAFAAAFCATAVHYAHVAAAVTLLAVEQVNQRFFHVPSLRLCVVANEEKSADQEILAALREMNPRLKKIDDIEKSMAEHKGDYEKTVQLVAEVQKANVELRKQILETRAARVRRGGEVSDECARYVGAIGLIAALKAGEAISAGTRIVAETAIKNILGIEAKTALTSSDIPLPTQYSGEVVELVFEFGLARKVGTVYPLGAGTVKLPKLGTDTTFGLIATSAPVTEKSPTIVFVTFSAEKFGGLIRLPQEIDEDSIVAMGQFLARYAARQIAYVEDWQFFMSTGAASGINGTAEGLAKAVVTDSCYVYNGGSSTSGKTKGSEAVLADFRAMRNTSTLSGVVLGRSKYYMHPTYEALLVSFNTSATVTPYIAGNGSAPAKLDGFEIVWTPVLPAFSASAAVSVVTCLFGDVSYQYLGLRNGIRFDTSREAGFATDEILIRALERLTVGLMASKAVAGLRNAAS